MSKQFRKRHFPRLIPLSRDVGSKVPGRSFGVGSSGHPVLLQDEEPVRDDGSAVGPRDGVGVHSELGAEIPIIDHDHGQTDRLITIRVHDAEPDRMRLPRDRAPHLRLDLSRCDLDGGLGLRLAAIDELSLIEKYRGHRDGEDNVRGNGFPERC